MLELAQLLLAQSNSSDATAPASVRFSDREETHDEALRLLLNAGAGGVVDAFVAVGELLESSAFFRDKAAALRFYSKAANATPVRERGRLEASECVVWVVDSVELTLDVLVTGRHDTAI